MDMIKPRPWLLPIVLSILLSSLAGGLAIRVQDALAVVDPSSDPAFDVQLMSQVAPTLSIADVSVNEGAGLVSLQISANPAPTTGVTVDVATSDGTAVAPGDYTAVPATTVTFPAGAAAIPIALPINDDALDELNETFSVTLSNPSAGTLISTTAGSATVTIVDNDPPPSVGMAVTTASVIEGDAGATTPVTLQVNLSSVSGLPVSVDFATADGTATVADGDYVASSGTLTIPAGSTSATISVVVNGDDVIEVDETFTVTLSNASTPSTTGSLTITQPTTQVTIVGPEPPPCALDLVLSYAAGTLTMDFTVGNLEPVTGSAWLVSGTNANLLGSIGLAINEPPISLSFPIPVAQQGTIGVLATLTTSSQGIICSTWVIVDTGPVPAT